MNFRQDEPPVWAIILLLILKILTVIAVNIINSQIK